MMEGWSPKEITTLLVQCGALGLCFLMMMFGVFLVAGIRQEIRDLHSVIFKMCCLVVDRNARPEDITPPELPRRKLSEKGLGES